MALYRLRLAENSLSAFIGAKIDGKRSTWIPLFDVIAPRGKKIAWESMPTTLSPWNIPVWFDHRACNDMRVHVDHVGDYEPSEYWNS